MIEKKKENGMKAFCPNQVFSSYKPPYTVGRLGKNSQKTSKNLENVGMYLGDTLLVQKDPKILTKQKTV